MFEKSRISLGFAAQATKPLETKPTEANEKTRNPEVRSFDNALCLLLYCVPHQKILLRRTVRREIYLPFKFFSQDRSWLLVSRSTFDQVLSKLGAKKFLSNLSQPEMLDVLGIDFPFNNRYYNRITMLSYYNPSQPKLKPGETAGKVAYVDDLKSRLVSAAENLRSQLSIITSKDNEKAKEKPADVCLCEHLYSSFVWMHIKHIETRMNNKFWGPEPLMFLKTLMEVGVFGDKFESAKTYLDIPIANCWSLKKDNAKINNMLEESKYRQKIIVRLYNEFICHCYPSRYMTLLSFKSFMQKFPNWNMISNEQYEKIFRALDFTVTNYLTFDELLLGFSAMDTITPHSGTTLELRLDYIFRMYNKNKNGKLSLEDMKAFGNDICSPITDKALLEQAQSVLQNYITKNYTKAYLTTEEFINTIVDSPDMTKLTMTIYRSPTSLLITITTRFDFHVRKPNIRKDKFYTKLTESLSVHYFDSCVRCKTFEFQILTDLQKISQQGDVVEQVNIEKDIKNQKIQFAVNTPEPALNEMMKNLKQCLDKPNEFWYYPNKQQLLDNLKLIFSRARETFAQDSKIKNISAPCFIFPGIQGVFSDLLSLEKLFWRPVTANIVISGNLLGADSFGSILCLVYFLCLKIMRPDRFCLLRGRHETQYIMTKLFLQHVNEPELSKILSGICDELPIAAVIEDQIFVSSGGIPKSMKSLEWYRRSILNTGKVTPELSADFVNDIWEEISKESKSTVDQSISSVKSASDPNKLFARAVSLGLFNHFRQQNGIKSCFLTHHQKKLATTIRLEFDCRLISLSAPEGTVINGRIISGALVAYDRIRLFEITNKNSTCADRKKSVSKNG